VAKRPDSILKRNFEDKRQLWKYFTGSRSGKTKVTVFEKGTQVGFGMIITRSETKKKKGMGKEMKKTPKL